MKYKETDALREKFKVSRKEKIRKGYIRSRWRFSGRPLVLRHDFSGKKIFSFKNKERIPSEEYPKKVFDIDISFRNLQTIYNAITFVREIRNYPIFDETERKRIFEALRELLYDPQVYRLKEEINARLAALQDEKKNKEHEQQRLWAAMEKVRDEVDLKEALTQNIAQLNQIEKQIKEREAVIRDLKQQLEECWRPPQLEKQEELTRGITQKKAELKRLKKQNETILKQIHEIDAEILPDIEERKKFLSENPICSTCFQNCYQEWDKRVKEFCPECGLQWDLESKRVASEDFSSTRATLVGQQSRLIKNINFLEDEIKSLENERKQLKDEYERNQKICQGIQAKIEDQRDKLDSQKLEKQNLNNHIQFLGEVMDPETRTNFDKLSTALEKIKEDIEKQEHDLEKLHAQIKGMMQDFIANVQNEFSVLTSNYLDFENISLDFLSGRIVVDEEVMQFFNMSGSERDVCDLAARISIWKSLIKFGKTEKGFLVIDSLDLYDEYRKKDMIKILQSLSPEEFMVIFATSTFETARTLSNIPKKYECERQGLWFFFRESQWLEDEEEEAIDQELEISSQD